MVISTTRIAPVGIVLPSSASATSSVSRSAMMPEPTTVATSMAVPSASAARRRGKIKYHDAQPAFGNSRPISSRRFCSASLSRVFIGRLMKIEIRLLSMR